MSGFMALLIGAIGTISITYILLHNARGAGKVLGSATTGYGNVARTFAGQ